MVTGKCIGCSTSKVLEVKATHCSAAKAYAVVWPSNRSFKRPRVLVLILLLAVEIPERLLEEEASFPPQRKNGLASFGVCAPPRSDLHMEIVAKNPTLVIYFALILPLKL